jgi:putative endonuclease
MVQTMTGRWTRSTNSNSTGAAIEKQAAHWLTQQVLTVISCNYRCRLGEIDLIMRDAEQLVFVEVRYRRQNSYGDGLESVDWRKQQKLLKTANHFLMTHASYADTACRFDVLGVKPTLSNIDQLQWNWIKNAFS